MLTGILIILIILWLLGFISIPGFAIRDIALFHFNGRNITLWDILIFIIVAWAVESLPSPLRQIGFILVVVWLLSQLGLIAIAGLSNLIVIAVAIGLVLAILQNR